MKPREFITRSVTRVVFSAMLWMSCLLPAGAAAVPRAVLVLDQTLPGGEFFVELSSAFRSTLNATGGDSIRIYLENLDLLRFGSPRQKALSLAYLRDRYKDIDIGVIVGIGPEGYKFALQAREQLWPESQLVFLTVEGSIPDENAVPTGVTGVTYSLTPDSSILAARTIVPNLQHIAVISGQFERKTFQTKLKEELPRLAPGVSLIDLVGLPLRQLQERVSGLPPATAILYLGLTVDGDGVNHDPRVALAALADVTKQPIIIDRDFYFGYGGVGGYIVDIGAAGAEAARMTARIINGESASAIPVEDGEFASPVFDWRVLKRFNISEGLLPPGSDIRFRQPGLWEQYKLYVIAGITLCMIEALFILLLLLNRHRLERERVERQKAEQTARDLNGRLISAQEDERARLARELHDDVTQRLALLAIEAGRDARASDAISRNGMADMRDSLIRLSEDVHSLSYRLHPSILDDLGLNEALQAECERFSRFESIPVDVRLEKDSDPPRDISLCLFRIAQEALRNVGRHGQAKTAEVSLRRQDDGYELRVRDDGVGFDPQLHRDCPSLGLASMQQRVDLLGGDFNIKSAPGRGTTVLAWIPLQEEPRDSSARVAG